MKFKLLKTLAAIGLISITVSAYAITPCTMVEKDGAPADHSSFCGCMKTDILEGSNGLCSSIGICAKRIKAIGYPTACKRPGHIDPKDGSTCVQQIQSAIEGGTFTINSKTSTYQSCGWI